MFHTVAYLNFRVLKYVTSKFFLHLLNLDPALKIHLIINALLFLSVCLFNFSNITFRYFFVMLLCQRKYSFLSTFTEKPL